MAEVQQNSTSGLVSSINRDSAGAASTSSSPHNVREEEEEVEEDRHQNQDQHLPELEQQHIGISYRGNILTYDETAAVIRGDTWSCIIVVLTFWFFVSVTLILGVYGSVDLLLGPNSSILIQPNPLFSQSVKVEELDETKTGLMLHGFYNSPPLDVVTSWYETHNVSIPADSHKENLYYLNKGSRLNISYSVNTPSSPILLIIAQGNELSQWLDDPTYPNTTLSWNIIDGSGMIHQDIYKSDSYYVAVGNLNSDKVEQVQLNVGVRALLYNTSESYYKCTFTQGLCSLEVSFPKGNSVVLTSSGAGQGTPNGEQYVRLSYGPRWVTYIVGIGGLTMFMLVAFNFLNKFHCIHEDVTRVQVGSERAPLLRHKDDDLSSWGSSYESASQDGDLEDFLLGGSFEGKSLKDDELTNNTRRLCAICFDAPRDCFFLPCGHCVSCFECGTRIVKMDGTCPVCCRSMKKIRKIFTV